MTKTRPFLSMCYGDPSATEVPPCCETATKKLTFSTTSVLLLLNMPLSLSRATIFRRQKNPRRVYRPKIAGILFVCNEPEGKYYTVPTLLDKPVNGVACPSNVESEAPNMRIDIQKRNMQHASFSESELERNSPRRIVLCCSVIRS